jgi:carbamate kinase
MSKIVIALGGNALGKTPSEQLSLVRETSKNIVDLVEMGNQVIVSHGNGPQVGMIYNNMVSSDMPFAECGAMSQGYIGYHLQQAIQRELATRGIKKDVATVITQVEVDKFDPGFNDPTKPIGVFYTEEEAKKLEKETGATFKEDAGRGWRRVIASPIPKKIVEIETIEKLIKSDTIVIACGGGGIPVIKEDNQYTGVAAVIDKDRTSALLALNTGADLLVILTAVPQVAINFNKPDQKNLSKLTLEEANTFIEKGEFAKGSMLPKVEACMYFVKESGNKAIITSLDAARDALNGTTGTTICREG